MNDLVVIDGVVVRYTIRQAAEAICVSFRARFAAPLPPGSGPSTLAAFGKLLTWDDGKFTFHWSKLDFGRDEVVKIW